VLLGLDFQHGKRAKKSWLKRDTDAKLLVMGA